MFAVGLREADKEDKLHRFLTPLGIS